MASSQSGQPWPRQLTVLLDTNAVPMGLIGPHPNGRQHMLQEPKVTLYHPLFSRVALQSHLQAHQVRNTPY